MFGWHERNIMYISKIEIENYRGIKEKEEINLSKFTSIIGKNDSGKSIEPSE